MPSARLTQGLWLLAALPVLVSAWLVHRYGVDVPFWDEWTIAPLLRQVDDRTIGLGSLLAQHNEHRMLVPRSLQLLAALGLGWDTRAGMWLSQALVLATLLGCVAIWRGQNRKADDLAAPASLAVVALVLFSPSQHQNFFWGFQVCFIIPAACLLASVLVASSPARSLGQALAVSAACSTIATLSILPGLLMWPLSALAIVLARGAPDRRNWRKWAAWAACWAGVLALYFVGYRPAARSPSVWPAFTAPLTTLAGAATTMGGFLGLGAQPVAAATITGALVAAVFLLLLIAVWRLRSDPALVAACAPWIVLGCFGLLTAVAISVGRVGFGYTALLESRYTSLTAWTLIAIVMLAATLRARVQTPLAIRTWIAVLLAILVTAAAAWPHHLGVIEREYNERLQSLAVYTFAERAPRPAPMLPPWVAWPPIRQDLIDIERSGWRRARARAPAWIDSNGGERRCGYGEVEFVETAGAQTIAGGWAYLPASERPADAVLVTFGSSRQIGLVQPPLIGRADVADRVHSDGALVTGWTLEWPQNAAGDVEFWALDVTSVRAYRLCSGTGAGSGAASGG